MEQHAGIGIRKSYLVLFVSIIFLRIKKIMMIIGAKLYVVWLFSSHCKAIITY